MNSYLSVLPRLLFVSFVLFFSAWSEASVPTAQHPASTTTSCIGTKACTLLTGGGVDLNEGTGFSWPGVNGGTGGLANIYVKVSVPAGGGTRSMSLWVNNVKRGTVTADATSSPRPTGKEIGPFAVTLNAGTNIIEVRDSENTNELDVYYVRTQDASGSGSTSSTSSSSSSTGSSSSSGSGPLVTTNYDATSTTGCTGAKVCTPNSWGMDLNSDTGYTWSNVGGGMGGSAHIYFRVASPSGSRSMSLWVNKVRVGTVTAASKRTAANGFSEQGPIAITLNSGSSNTIELRDTEGTAEFDVGGMRILTRSLNATIGSGITSATYNAASTSACNGAKVCVFNTAWGIDLNTDTGFIWNNIDGQEGGNANIFISVASPSGSRSMSLWVNNMRVRTITSSTPRTVNNTFTEQGPFPIILNAGRTNTIELRDTEGTAEFDIRSIKVEQTQAAPNFNISDVGATAKLGSTRFINGKLIISASGKDIGGNFDQFHFVNAPLNSDGEVIANIESVTEPNSWAKVGLMIRNGLDDSAENAFIFMRPSLGSGFQYRNSNGELTGSTWEETPYYTNSTTEWLEPTPHRVRYLKPNKWLRLVKNGNKVSAYSSNDGKCWVTRWHQDIAFSGNSLLAGVALTSHDNNLVATAVISDLTVRSTAPTTIQEINKECDRAQVDGTIAPPSQWILAPSSLGNSNWSYTNVNPANNQRPASCIPGDMYTNRREYDHDPLCPAKITSAPWANSGFIYDSNWKQEQAMGFGLISSASPTPVPGNEIWLRKEINLTQSQIDNLVFWGRWAEGVAIFVNGNLATSFNGDGYQGINFYLGLSPKARQALRPGNNVFAVYAKCSWCNKGAILDFGIAIHPQMANLPITDRISTPGTSEAKLGDLFIDYTNRMGSLGGSLAIYKDFQLVESVAVGWQDVSLNKPLKRNSMMRFSSSDKRVIETMLVNMYNENGLNPDAKVFGENGILSHIKPINNLWGKGVRDITVDQLRLGTSGLPEETGDNQLWIDQTAMNLGVHTDSYNIDERVRNLISRDTIFTPGSGTAYSNTAPAVILAIHAKITRKTTAEYFSQDMGFEGIAEAGERLKDRPGNPGERVGYQTIGIETYDRWVTIQGALAASPETMVKFLLAYAPTYKRVILDPVTGKSEFIRQPGSHGASMQGTRGGLQVNPLDGSGISLFWNSDQASSLHFEIGLQTTRQQLPDGSCNPTEQIGERFRIQNYWRPTQFLMTQPLDGSTEPNFGIRAFTNPSFESAKWRFYPVADAPDYYLIKNAWDAPRTLTQVDGKLTALLGVSDADQAAHWKLVDRGSYFLIESRINPNNRINYENEELQISGYGEGSHSTRWWLCN